MSCTRNWNLHRKLPGKRAPCRGRAPLRRFSLCRSLRQLAALQLVALEAMAAAAAVAAAAVVVVVGRVLAVGQQQRRLHWQHHQAHNLKNKRSHRGMT